MIAYNLDDKPLVATMTGWDVAPGVWKLTQQVGEGAAAAPAAAEPRHVEFERTRGLDITFAPRATTEVNLEFETPGKPMWDRPDLGIGSSDVQVPKGGAIRVTVHSLGSVPAPPSTVTLFDAAGRSIASVHVPAMAAPLDLIPKTAQVTLHVRPGQIMSGARVRVQLNEPGVEITQLNNEVVLR